MLNEKENIGLVILEDEASHSEAIRRSLMSSHCDITVAATLKDFFQHIDKHSPDFVIADMNLPDGNAFSILKGSLENQPWPVLVMTSFGDEEMAVKAIKSGALDYIVKSPESFKNIQQVVNRNLREWKIIQKGRKSENALRESEKKFRTLFETMNQGVIYHNANGDVISLNPATERILGLPAQEIFQIASLSTKLDLIHEDGSKFHTREFPAFIALNSGIEVKDVIMGFKHKGKGGNNWFLMTSVPQFRDNETKPYQVITTFADITALKQAEEKLQQQNEDLKKAKEKAEESDLLKSAFLANMSHEIRTPMNGILGFAELLKNPNISVESQRKYIEVIEMSGLRMLDIINDLIDISKIESGQIEVKNEIIDVGKILKDLLLFFIPESRKKKLNLKLNNQLPDEYNSLETDRTKITQVITNLIKNALKFTNEGTVEFGCKIEDQAYVFYVKDTGVGIKEELQQRIFERFRQGEADAAKLNEGVGLGLAISKAYVELLGGKIHIESEPSKGSTFSFTIPLKEKMKEKEFISDEDDHADGTINNMPCSNILIAEDDVHSYIFLKTILESNNITTYYAKDGQDAVNAMKKNPFINLVLMDIRMPIMNGLEATRQIRQSNSNVPIIAQSAFSTDNDIQNALKAGCNDFIQKPVDKNLLLKKIAAHCL